MVSILGKHVSVMNTWMRTHLGQIIKFGLAGGTAFIVDFTGFNLIIAYTYIDPRFASIFSAPLALATVFLMNKFVTFRGRGGKTTAQVVRFGIVYGIAFLLNVGLTALFITLGVHLLNMNMTTLLSNASKILAVGCVMFWNYSMLHLFVFATSSTIRDSLTRDSNNELTN